MNQTYAQPAHQNGADNNHSTDDHILQVFNLKKNFGSKQVVKDVSLYMKGGEVVGLLGPNGAGKTTCFYMIVGLVAATSGRIHLNHKNIISMPIHERALMGLGYLPQEMSIFRKMNVEENILSILELHISSPTERRKKLESLLVDLNIEYLRDNSALSLSGGERRRVEIARALATSPRFILLDEPFAGVDPIAVIDIQKIIEFLKSKNIGVLITDHNVRETLRICDRAYIINKGEVLASGYPNELINNPDVKRVYLGENFNF